MHRAPGAGCDGEGCPGYSVWEQGPEPQPNSFPVLFPPLFANKESVNMTGIYERGEIVAQPFKFVPCRQTQMQHLTHDWYDLL